jgi:sensor histidine kinase YesM
MILPLHAFETDRIAIAHVSFKEGVAFACVLIAVFAAILAVALIGIVKYILTLKKAKESELRISRLEAEKKVIEEELEEIRISMMLSRIQPHFIYNTLGTIEYLCLKDPKIASDLVRDLALYLRGNLSELDSVTPISFSNEIKHVQYYVNIENVRFPDMTIEYQLDNIDFVLPAISVQPLVENAIKHGLMPLESGGRVVIRSYQTDTHFCVEVTDNGVGFDTGCLIDKKEHVGLYNVRERLRAIVNGELRVESTEGAGTTATILIPKEKTT